MQRRVLVSIVCVATLLAAGPASAHHGVVIPADETSPADDLIAGTNHVDEIHGGDGADIVFFKKGSDHGSGGIGIDRFFLGKGKDSVTTSSGDDIVVDEDGGKKKDDIDTIAGGDLIYTADGGKDEISCSSDAGEIVIADPNDDVATSCESIIRASTGNVFIGTNGSDNQAGPGDAIVAGRKGNDFINGGTGFDVLLGGPGKDTLNGGNDADTIYDDDGGRKPDTLNGDAGVDIIYSADGADDVINCGGDPNDKAYVDEVDDVTGCDDVIVVEPA